MHCTVPYVRRVAWCRPLDGVAANCHAGRSAHIQQRVCRVQQGVYLASLSPPPSSAAYLHSKFIQAVFTLGLLLFNVVGYVRGTDVHTFVTVPPLDNLGRAGPHVQSPRPEPPCLRWRRWRWRWRGRRGRRWWWLFLALPPSAPIIHIRETHHTYDNPKGHP